MIKKIGSKYVVVAESGRKMGTYKTKKEAKERLRQIEFFKHLSKRSGRSRRSIGYKCLSSLIENGLWQAFEKQGIKGYQAKKKISLDKIVDLLYPQN